MLITREDNMAHVTLISKNNLSEKPIFSSKMCKLVLVQTLRSWQKISMVEYQGSRV